MNNLKSFRVYYPFKTSGSFTAKLEPHLYHEVNKRLAQKHRIDTRPHTLRKDFRHLEESINTLLPANTAALPFNFSNKTALIHVLQCLPGFAEKHGISDHLTYHENIDWDELVQSPVYLNYYVSRLVCHGTEVGVNKFWQACYKNCTESEFFRILNHSSSLVGFIFCESYTAAARCASGEDIIRVGNERRCVEFFAREEAFRYLVRTAQAIRKLEIDLKKLRPATLLFYLNLYPKEVTKFGLGHFNATQQKAILTACPEILRRLTLDEIKQIGVPAKVWLKVLRACQTITAGIKRNRLTVPDGMYDWLRRNLFSDKLAGTPGTKKLPSIPGPDIFRERKR